LALTTPIGTPFSQGWITLAVSKARISLNCTVNSVSELLGKNVSALVQVLPL